MKHVVLALIATLLVAGCVGQTAQKTTTTAGEDTITPTGVTKEFTISGVTDIATGKFYFNKGNLTVKAGDSVKIIFTSTDITTGHTFNIDEYNAHSSVTTGGSKVVVEFYADKKGEFKYYCNIGDHRTKGMEGTLVVE